MTEDPEDKGINERQRIQRIKKLPMRRKSAGLSKILKMIWVYFHIFPHRPDFRHSVTHLEISRNSIKGESNAHESIGPSMER
jgi:hypothetical protein